MIHQLVNKKLLTTFQDMNTLMQSSSSYKNMRQTLKVTTPPLVPYLGIFLSDLTFIEDGNQDSTETGLINIEKRRLLSTVITDINQYQLAPYAFQEVSSIKEMLLKVYFCLQILIHHSLNLWVTRKFIIYR